MRYLSYLMAMITYDCAPIWIAHLSLNHNLTCTVLPFLPRLEMRVTYPVNVWPTTPVKSHLLPAKGKKLPINIRLYVDMYVTMNRCTSMYAYRQEMDRVILLLLNCYQLPITGHQSIKLPFCKKQEIFKECIVCI